MANVTFLPAAEADYKQALAWYQERSARAMAGFEAAVDAALRRIAGGPEQWASCDDRHRLYTLRRYPYSVIYRIEGKAVLVVAVAHSSRDESFWQDRR